MTNDYSDNETERLAKFLTERLALKRTLDRYLNKNKGKRDDDKRSPAPIPRSKPRPPPTGIAIPIEEDKERRKVVAT